MPAYEVPGQPGRRLKTSLSFFSTAAISAEGHGDLGAGALLLAAPSRDPDGRLHVLVQRVPTLAPFRSSDVRRARRVTHLALPEPAGTNPLDVPEKPSRLATAVAFALESACEPVLELGPVLDAPEAAEKLAQLAVVDLRGLKTSVV